MNKNFFAVLTLIATAAFGYFFYAGLEQETAPATSQVVAPAPASSKLVDFSLPDLDGIDHQISEWNGKARLINFWATWCAPCRREIPLLKKTQTAHVENNLQVIGIAVEDLEPVIAYAEEAEFNYPVLVGQEDAMAAAEASGIDFIGLPFTMIVAPDGQLIKAHIGEIHEDQMALIIETFEQMRNGELDIASAKSALKTL
jgi:thiol-disulfide isomerase/thioredoxin